MYRIKTENRTDGFTASRTDKTAKPKDLTGVNGKVYILKAIAAKMLRPKDLAAYRTVHFGEDAFDRAPDH